jgi:hypothetical protein
MIKYLITLLLLLPNIATATCIKPTAVQGAVADTVTTLVGIELFGLTETNPAGFIGSTAIKIISLTYAADASPEKQKEFNNTAGAFWSAAAVNNIAAILGATNPVSIVTGIVSGMIFYNMPQCEKKDD